MIALCAFLLPLVLSCFLTAVLIRLAPRLRLVDHPGDRKVHTQVTPKGGGVAIYSSLLVTAVALYACLPSRFGLLLLAGSVIVVLGIVDDFLQLPWQFRLGVQAAATAGAIWLVPAGNSDWRMQFLGIFWVVGLVNAFNMLDNMDAQSPGVAAIAAGMLGLSNLLSPWEPAGLEQAVPELMLAGAVLGFLFWNRPPARIFMGDAGSTLLGFLLGIRTLQASPPADAPLHFWLVPLFILAVPWYDMTLVICLRLWQGRSPFHGDKQHLSHRLTDLGLSRPAAVGVILVLALASGLAGLSLYFVTPLGALLLSLQFACWWVGLAGIEYVRKYSNCEPPPKL